MLTYSFLSDHIVPFTPLEKYFQGVESKPPYPRVLYTGPLGDGTWQAPVIS
jgi:hypothetical protein